MYRICGCSPETTVSRSIPPHDYIYHCYDALHSDSLENVTAELIGLLKKRGG